ncbi:MAG: hypothetical protein JWM34_1956 [Ilumatobacteraceae bacterium]|nr:hypothetical protein [Ilumatobacteraceae bacterium]
MTAMLSRPATSSTDAASVPKRLPILDLVGIAGLGAVIAIHTSELSGKVEETAYLGFGYMLLIAACITAIVMIAHHDVRGWMLGGLTAASTFVGYVLTRTTGLPKAKGDIGNWGETIGVWSLVAEGLVVVVAIAVLLRRRTVR